MNCKECKDGIPNPISVPFPAYESMVFSTRGVIVRLWALCLVLVVLLFGTNAAWIWYESQWEVVETTEVTQENEGGYNNYVGRDGEIVNGEANHQDDQKQAKKNWG